MRTVEKVSVALSPSDLDWARRRAENEGESLSSVVSAALRRERQAEARGKLLDLLGGDEVTQEVINEVRAELYGGQ